MNAACTINIRPGVRFVGEAVPESIVIDFRISLDGRQIMALDVESARGRKPSPADFESFPVAPGTHILAVESTRGGASFTRKLAIDKPVWVQIEFTWVDPGHPRARERGLTVQTFDRPTCYR